MLHNSKTKEGAKKLAARFRKKGYNCTIYNKKGLGWAVYVKRK